MQDDDLRQTAPSSSLEVKSTEPIESVEINTLDAYKQARLRASVILNRHRARGTFQKLNALKDSRTAMRRKPDAANEKSNSRNACVAANLLFAMANFFGVIRPNCTGLMILDETIEGDNDQDGSLRQKIADAAGVSFKSTYPAIRDLVAVGVLRRIPRGGPKGDLFELSMPPITGEELEKQRLEEEEKARAKPQRYGLLSGYEYLPCGLARANPLEINDLARAKPYAYGLARASYGLPEGSDQPDLPFSPENEDARAKQQGSPESHVHVHVCNVLRHVLFDEGQKDVELLLRSVRIDEDPLGQGGIHKALKSPSNCTRTRFYQAVDILEKTLSKGKKINAPAYLIGLLCTNTFRAPTAGDGLSHLPEHAREIAAATRLDQAADEAELKSIKEALAARGSMNISDRALALAKREHSLAWASRWREIAQNPHELPDEEFILRALWTGKPISRAGVPEEELDRSIQKSQDEAIQVLDEAQTYLALLKKNKSIRSPHDLILNPAQSPAQIKPAEAGGQ